MMEVKVGYGTAELKFKLENDLVRVKVKGEKSWKLGNKKVSPFNGEITFKAQDFITLLEGVFGIEQALAVSLEGKVMRVKYDWEGWERGDDCLKVAVIDYPEKATMFYFSRFNRVLLTTFILYVKAQTPVYSFKHWDVSFIRHEGELLCAVSGEEREKFSEKEVELLKRELENHFFANAPFNLNFLDASLYTKKSRFTLTFKEHKQLFLKLYCAVA